MIITIKTDMGGKELAILLSGVVDVYGFKSGTSPCQKDWGTPKGWQLDSDNNWYLKEGNEPGTWHVSYRRVNSTKPQTLAQWLREHYNLDAKADGGPLRQELSFFTMVMERELKKNDHKRGAGGLERWKSDDLDTLFRRLVEEQEELWTAISLVGTTPDFRNDIIKEAADVANFAMMIADVARSH